MKSLFLVFMFAISNIASANSFYCVSKYYAWGEGKFVLEGDIVSATSIKNVSLTGDGEKISYVKSMKKDPNYKPRKYKGFMSMQGTGGKRYPGPYEDASTTAFLVQEGFKSLKKFQIVIGTQASDGGSYSKFFCYNNPSK